MFSSDSSLINTNAEENYNPFENQEGFNSNLENKLSLFQINCKIN